MLCSSALARSSELCACLMVESGWGLGSLYRCCLLADDGRARISDTRFLPVVGRDGGRGSRSKNGRSGGRAA